MPNRPYSSRGWSATQRPYYDLDFTDAFAAQMLALARQRAMAGTEAEERRRAAEERKTAATVAHQRGQEDIALREVLARQGEEAGRKARADEAAALRKELLNRENAKLDDEARSHLRNIKASGSTDEQNRAAQIEREWDKMSPDERKLSSEALDKVMTARVVAEAARAPIQTEMELEGGGAGIGLIDPTTGMTRPAQQWQETEPITIAAPLPFQIPWRKKVPVRKPGKEAKAPTVFRQNLGDRAILYDETGNVIAEVPYPAPVGPTEPTGEDLLEMAMQLRKADETFGKLAPEEQYAQALEQWNLWYGKRPPPAKETKELGWLEAPRFKERMRPPGEAAPEAGQPKAPAKSLKDMTTEELLELRKRKQAGQ